jgi:peroxiredoxin/outer membrane lipoprotein-sorting protein
MMRTTWMTACVAMTALVGQAHGQVAEDAKALINESAQAMLNTKGVTFHVQKSATSMLKDIVDLSGDVKIFRAEGASGPVWMVDGRAKQPGKPDKKVVMVTDGKVVKWLDFDQATYFERPAGDNAAMEPEKLAEQILGVQDWIMPKPFTRELGMDTMTKGAADKVGDVVCDVVELSAKSAPGRTTTVHFGAADKLPRRYELASGTGKDKIAMITEVTNLKVAPLTAKDMELNVPSTFKRDAQPNGMQPQGSTPAPEAPKVDLGLKPGTDAPSFNAEDMSGKRISLEAVKGKPVVMEFWGPMFKQSTKNADAMKAFASDAGKNGVQVVSFACRDSAGKAGEMWKTSGATYPLVPKGDAVADQFKVAGFPTYIVLDKNGKVAAYFQDFPGADKLMQATASADK